MQPRLPQQRISIAASRRWDLLRPVIGKVLAPYVPDPVQVLGREGTALVDGTVCPVWDWSAIPDLYSGKAKYTGMNVQIACSLKVSTRKSCERARRHSAWRSLAATPVTVLLIRGSAVRRRLGPGAEVLGAGVPGQEPAECLAGQGLSVVAAAFIEVGGQVGDDVQPGQLGSRDDGPDTGGGPGGARVMGAASILPGHDRCPDRALGQVIVLRGLHLTGAAQVSALPRESAWRGRLPA